MACSILNMADVQGRDNAEAFDALKTIEGVEPLALAVVRRKAFPNAFSSGLSVTELQPRERDPKAIDELLSVVDALYTQKVDNGYQDASRRKA